MTVLFHYTCDHGWSGIREAGEVRANEHPLLGEPLSWWTDLDAPLRDALGLTSYVLACDRTAYRVSVELSDCPEIVWWPRWARRRVPPQVRAYLESAPGAAPAHWYVAERAVPVPPVAGGAS